MKRFIAVKGKQGKGRASKLVPGGRLFISDCKCCPLWLYEAICQDKCDCPRKVSKCTYKAGKPKALPSAPLDNLEQMINAILHELAVILPEKPQRKKP